jgi:hypothetical protein
VQRLVGFFCSISSGGGKAWPTVRASLANPNPDLQIVDVGRDKGFAGHKNSRAEQKTANKPANFE